jgi:hypothetical protein
MFRKPAVHKMPSGLLRTAMHMRNPARKKSRKAPGFPADHARVFLRFFHFRLDIRSKVC